MKLIDYREGQYPSQADPFLIHAEDGWFYMYVTGTEGVHAFKSRELTGEYEDIGVVFSLHGHRHYWAPSVIRTHGKYHMYVSFVPEDSNDAHAQSMHVATSDTPYGPFGNVKPLVAPFSIDSHVVENESGLFIFYSQNDYDDPERPGTYIVVDRLLDPYTAKGDPVAVVRPTIDEEIFAKNRFGDGRNWHTIEGAFYFREGDYHYVIYSGSCFQNEFYFLGYSVAKTAETDLTKISYQKYPDEHTYAPLLAKNEFESGTGHNSVIKVDGQYYLIYHGRDNGLTDSQGADRRTARICKLHVNSGILSAERYADRI